MSIKSNFIFLSVYKLFEMLLPLITSPILSRRLRAESLGIYSYSYSIVSIFVVVAELGFYRYGLREIAKCRDNQQELNQVYSDIFFTHIINAVIVILIYFVYIIFVIDSNDTIYFFLQGILIINNMIDNAFFYVGIEHIKELSIRDSITKIAAFLLIVVFVQSKNDLVLYIIIMALSALISKIIALVYSRRFVRFVKPNLYNCIRHYKPMLFLMVPALASVIYHSMDKIMIGELFGKADVGYYECASKALVPRNIITVLGTVLCPRIVFLYENGRKEEAVIKVQYSFVISMIMSYAFMFGIISIAADFAPWFWGSDFSVCSDMLVGLSLTIPIWTIGEVIRNQYLLPLGYDKKYSFSFIFGVLTNAFLNFFLIPIYGANGAIFATIIAELLMSISQIIIIYKEIPLFNSLLETIPYCLSGILMYYVVCLLKYFAKGANAVTLICLEIIFGITCYLVFALILEKIFGRHYMKSCLKRIF